MKNNTFEEALIKEAKVKDRKVLQQIKTTLHKNLVYLNKALYHDGSIFFFYEVMDVSLSQVFSNLHSQLWPYEVAAFCMEVLAGIKYIHEILKQTHSLLSGKTILLNISKDVKIGNNSHPQNYIMLIYCRKYWHSYAPVR